MSGRAVGILCTALAGAAATAIAGPPSDGVQVRHAEEVLAEARVGGDRVAVAELLADEYMGVESLWTDSDARPGACVGWREQHL